MKGLLSRDGRDIVGGALLVVIGLAFAGYGAWHYNLGRVASMGPGMFPATLGLMLAFTGLLILIPGLLRKGGEWPRPELRPLFLVMAGTIAFALSIQRFGIVVAIFALVMICSSADGRLGWIGRLILASGLSIAALLIFVHGLGIPIRVLPWSH